MKTFDDFQVSERHKIDSIPVHQHRISMWYEDKENAELEELLSLTFWQIHAIWEGLQLYEQLLKRKKDIASESGQQDLRQYDREIESCVMAKRKVSAVRRYMASKHQKQNPGSLMNQIIETALQGENNERDTGEDS